MTVKQNQYGAFPCKTYFYIDDNGYTWHHSDKKWRKKELIELWSYAYPDKQSAEREMIGIPTSRQQLISQGRLWQVSPGGEPDSVLLEGTKAECQKFIAERFPGHYKNGMIRLGRIIYEPEVNND